MFIDRMFNRLKGGADKAQNTPVSPDQVIILPEHPPAAKPENDGLDGFFTKMDVAKPVSSVESVEIKDILAPPAPPPPAPSSAPAPAPAESSPKPASPSQKEDLMASIFRPEEKEENVALTSLIASLPEVTLDDLLNDINLLKELIQESVREQEDESSPPMVSLTA